MKTSVNRQTVDLSGYPDLVVIYLGMPVRTWAGVKTLIGLGPQIDQAGHRRPEGLLHFENGIIFSLRPLHVGMRWYWQDFGSMERWARSEPHRQWWQNFLGNSGGTGFWHETYLMRGGMEAVYDDVARPVGLLAFAPGIPARGPMFSSRGRAQQGGEVPAPPTGKTEGELYAELNTGEPGV
jgi:hypothetical protein